MFNFKSNATYPDCTINFSIKRKETNDDVPVIVKMISGEGQMNKATMTIGKDIYIINIHFGSMISSFMSYSTFSADPNKQNKINETEKPVEKKEDNTKILEQKIGQLCLDNYFLKRKLKEKEIQEKEINYEKHQKIIDNIPYLLNS